MLLSTEYLVLLLMLPVTVFIIIPLFLFVGWMTIMCINDLVTKSATLKEKAAQKQKEDGLQPSQA